MKCRHGHGPALAAVTGPVVIRLLRPRALLLSAVLAAVALAGAAPDASAHRGSRYVVTGTAVGDALGLAFDARMEWSGQQVGHQGQVTLDFFDPATGSLVHRNRFPAVEDVEAFFFEGCREIVDPYSLDAVAAPEATFRIGGVWRVDLCTAQGEHDFTGRYLTLFALDLHLRGFFSTP